MVRARPSGRLSRLETEIGNHLAGRTTHLHSEHRIRHADGEWRWVISRGLASRAADGTATRMAGSLSDITGRRVAELRLRHDALHDHLTGLPNRTLFTNRLDHVLARSARDPTDGCAVMFLDIDRFKLVNDSLSHSVGDELLKAIAERIAAAVRPGDTVARLGGDEFTVLLEHLVDPLLACEIGDRVLHSLDDAFEVSERRLFVSASSGIALSSSELAPAELMRNADLAMYDAKRAGVGRGVLFDESMHQRVTTRLTRENELRQAISGSLLRVHYQPIIDLCTGRIHSLEALARWPAGWAPVWPAEFIAIAEETGVIGAVGMHVLSTALTTLADWRERKLVSEEVYMSVNLSPRQLDDPDLAAQISATIARIGLPASALRLEITESTLMSNIERTQTVFAEICGSGVGLHLDDFGTGYASLTALHSYPVDALKIDRSFVATIADGGDTESDLILSSTVALAQSLHLSAIAEGIETAQQLDRLQRLGCELGQGYLFAPPLSAEQMSDVLARWRPAEIAELVAA